MKKYLFVLFTVVAVSLFYVLSPHQPYPPPIAPLAAASATTDLAPRVAPHSQSTSLPTANATLRVGSTTYPIVVSSGDTVLTVMQKLASTNAFSYTSREFPSLGAFVDSIKGVKNGGGKYWVFYVNGVSATQGVSNTIIHGGDLIEWEYEQGY